MRKSSLLIIGHNKPGYFPLYNYFTEEDDLSGVYQIVWTFAFKWFLLVILQRLCQVINYLQSNLKCPVLVLKYIYIIHC